MKRLLSLLTVLLLFPFTAGAQGATSPLVFDSMTFDFGTVDEAGGTLFHTFTFINGASFPVRISNISASCNCVSVSYPQSSLKGGETGEISVAFNPVGLGGQVVRQVEVFLGDSQPGVTLEISADIVRSNYDINEEYKVALPGGLRLKTLSTKFGYVPVGRSSEQKIDIVNTSSEAIRVEAEPLEPGSHLTVACPASLAPGEAGALILRYSFGKSAYGSFSDDVQILVNGSSCNRTVSTSAVAVDDFKASSSNSVPTMQIYPSALKVRKIPVLGKYVTSFEIANNGKADLVVRAVSVPEGVETDLPDGSSISPGRKRKVNVRADKASFSVEVVVNDPVRPFKELRTSIQ